MLLHTSSQRSILLGSFALLCTACSGSTPQSETPKATTAEVPEQEQAREWVPGPSPDEIKKAVRTRNTELRQCYIAGTFKNAQLAGTVNVTFTIDTTGKVSKATDGGSNLPDQEVVRCVLDVFAQLQFCEGSTTPTEVTYPVKFGSLG